ncbi:Fic family protein [Pelagicoccus sp. SDUM812005]|uniref:Fic family protein n=1 Tax=Pelagicoccus sp. SDUM812005 TaxID=3041257 RepID=UPI00280CDE2C|nr:Fic family protein [Pelagicoccus sp. SDUM812005]MDQ8180355.1 Fic family protein [Pelagicoccus sp. SDUM812005]
MRDFEAGKWLMQTGFRSFEPSPINRPWRIDEPRVLEALSRADRNLGRLDMFSEYVPNLDLFVRMHVAKEATESSRIEDTQTEMEEALLPEEEILEERRDDWREVNNYISAMDDAISALAELPFSTRLLKRAHATLMSGVRGEHKTPGEFRRSQNWIGGSNPGNARFVPPIQENVPELMGDLDLFAHNGELHLPPLLKVAIMHYQFETIHPFLDGNGRIGRLMVPLYLVSQGILKKPVLYLSDYLERNREEYYERLTRVRSENAIDDWLHFFLDGLSETAARGVETFSQILKFKTHWEAEISSWKPQAASGLALFQFLFTNIWVNAQIVSKATEVSQPTAYKLIERFVDCGLLREMTGAKRGRLFLFEPYLKLFKQRD